MRIPSPDFFLTSAPKPNCINFPKSATHAVERTTYPLPVRSVVIPFWILDCRFWLEGKLTGQASHLGKHSANFISCIIGIRI